MTVEMALKNPTPNTPRKPAPKSIKKLAILAVVIFGINLVFPLSNIIKFHTAHAAPIAMFLADPLAGDVPLSVQFTFTGACDAEPCNYEWDFDNDGTPEIPFDPSASDPLWTYTAAGTYSVKLTVRNSASVTDTYIATNYITAAEPGTTIIGQTVDPSTGALTLACDLNTAVFEFDPILINSPDPLFYSTYINPKIPYSEITTCDDGSGLVVYDTRYSGGFVLQINATDYHEISAPSNTIPVTSLSFLTEQANTSYSEDASGSTAFAGGGTPLSGSQADEAEIEYVLPFDFNFYGINYNTVYLCSNGIINFSDGDADPVLDTNGDCSPDPATVFEDPGPAPHILPYYKDLDLDSGIDPSFGISAVSGTNDVRFRWKGAPSTNLSELVEFEVIITDDGEEDYITFNYADGTKIIDNAPGPLVGVTKGGPAAPPISATYTESFLSRSVIGSDLANGQVIFKSGFDFTEVKKPGTPAAVAQYNGNPAHTADFEPMTDTDSDGTSDAFDLINGHVTPSGFFVPGRIGIYTIYPSFRIGTPAVPDGTYKNTITFTLTDSTGP